MRSHTRFVENYMKLPYIMCNVNINEITNRISVRPIMVWRVSVSSSHLMNKYKNISFSLCCNLEGYFLQIMDSYTRLTTVTTKTITTINIFLTMRRKRPRLCLSILHRWIMPSSENIEKTAAVDWRETFQSELRTKESKYVVMIITKTYFRHWSKTTPEPWVAIVARRRKS